MGNPAVETPLLLYTILPFMPSARRCLILRGGDVRHFPLPGVEEAARAMAWRSERGPSVRWASADRPVTSGDGVALSNGNVPQVARGRVCFSASSSAPKRGSIAAPGKAWTRLSSSVMSQVAMGSLGRSGWPLCCSPIPCDVRDISLTSLSCLHPAMALRGLILYVVTELVTAAMAA